jgi:molecular chaperone DnaK (HSP70)
MSEKEEQLWPCFTCKNNGFPNEMIILAGKDERGSAIRKNPDKSPHIHKSKLAGGGYRPPQQQQIPMTQPLSSQSNKTKDEEIARMHVENQEDRKAYREVLKEDVDAKMELARAINKLAEAIKERGLNV